MSDNTKFEKQCARLGHRFVAGVDEVGVGCLAGPVVAAAVILRLEDIPEGIDDSKRLTHRQREALDIEIRKRALCYSVAHSTVDEIDSINIFHAARLAMVRAVEALSPVADFLLIDGRHTLSLSLPQKAIVQGDRLSVSVGAASILAKVYRDQWMARFDDEFPGYHFADHKGYGSVAHRRALEKLGRSPIHRRSFSWTPV